MKKLLIALVVLACAFLAYYIYYFKKFNENVDVCIASFKAVHSFEEKGKKIWVGYYAQQPSYCPQAFSYVADGQCNIVIATGALPLWYCAKVERCNCRFSFSDVEWKVMLQDIYCNVFGFLFESGELEWR